MEIEPRGQSISWTVSLHREGQQFRILRPVQPELEFNYYDITPGATIDIFSNDGLIADQVPNPRTSVTLKFVGDLGLIVGNPDATPGFVIFTGKIEGDVDENNPAP